MITEILMPRYGWDTSVAKIVEWLKKEGDNVTKGDPLFLLETAKVTGEVPALGSGILRKVLVPEGDTVSVGKLVGIIADTEDDIESYLRPVEPIPQFEEKIIEREVKVTKRIDVKASPLAKRLAKEHDISLQNIQGTGPGGRITKEDVLMALEAQKETYEVIPLTGLRKAIAEHMAHSAQTTARVTQFIKVDLSKIVELRRNLRPSYQKEYGVRLTYSHIFVKAAASALKDHPSINSIFIEDEIRLIKNINIGVAVATNEGLIVTIIKNTDEKNLAQIALTMTELTEKARQGKLSPEETSGSTFTITNAGVFGIDFSTPLINTPETAILGIGTIAERPMVIDGQVVARPTVYLSFSYDHRVIDGAPAARFLRRVKQLLEEPSNLIK